MYLQTEAAGAAEAFDAAAVVVAAAGAFVLYSSVGWFSEPPLSLSYLCSSCVYLLFTLANSAFKSAAFSTARDLSNSRC